MSIPRCWPMVWASCRAPLPLPGCRSSRPQPPPGGHGRSGVGPEGDSWGRLGQLAGQVAVREGARNSDLGAMALVHSYRTATSCLNELRSLPPDNEGQALTEEWRYRQ